ncbi:MAG: hypothetical protein ABW048_12320 [Sphingobium sp.]
MALDLIGGYDPAFDYPLGARPENPQLRDSVSMWISDNERFAFPRMCIEAVADEWDNRGIQTNIAFSDGRVLIGAGEFVIEREEMRLQRYGHAHPPHRCA